MTVGFVTPEYPHPLVRHAAGIGTSTQILAQALVKKGVKVVVFVYGQKLSKELDDFGVSIHLIKNQSYPILGWFFHRKYINAYINSVVAKEKIDLVEAADWTGITAFMKFKVPLIIRLHGSDAYFCNLEGRKQRLKNKWFESLGLKNAEAYIAPSSFAGKASQKIFNFDENKIITIHNGLDLSVFKNSTPLNFQHKTIVYVGTIIRKKGVLELAEIFNKVLEEEPDSKLILIGSDTPDIKTQQRSTYDLVFKLLSEEAKNRVRYLGKIPYEEVQVYIKQAHVCVFPSFAETFGMVTIEAMALQKPVVNTSIGWGQELIDDGEHGFLVHPNEIDMYSDRILKLFKDLELCVTLGKQARLKVERDFDIEEQALKNIEFYKTIIRA